ncbi:MAG: AzlC family ABC transporter permease [Clostridia bacterium]|nr:AzlC family ABC transporter permease [Clostridia bacterium]
MNGSGIKKGFLDGIPIALGYWPVAMAYGLLAKSVGLNFFECTTMSVMVFAGASQFMTLNLIASGVGMGEIAAAVFLVNLRHLLMSLSLSPKVLAQHRGIRALLSFGITDETFAVASVKEKYLSSGYLGALELISYSSWVLGSAAGFAAGAFLPETLQESMGIALYAMFIGLLVPLSKKSRKVLFIGVLAGILNGILGLFISKGWAVIAAAILAALMVPGTGEGGENHDE